MKLGERKGVGKEEKCIRCDCDLSGDRRITATLPWVPGDLEENVAKDVFSPPFQELRHRLEAFSSL